MGLDVYAIRGIAKVADTEPEDEAPDGHLRLWSNKDFPGRDEGAPTGLYSYQERYGGFSMGYGTYYHWRQALATLAGYTAEDAWAGKTAGKPFDELINFSDCEGTIGPVVAAKLAHDFAEYDDKAKASQGEDSLFYDKYRRMRAIMEFAADTGAVRFT